MDQEPARPRRARDAARAVALDLTPLRVSRDYRLLWTGQFVSELGYQFARVAIYVQVFDLTGSAAAVGLTGLTGLLALIAGSLVGSSFIDARDRRSILMWSQVFMALAAGSCLRARSRGGRRWRSSTGPTR
jgi:MFS family permease